VICTLRIAAYIHVYLHTYTYRDVQSKKTNPAEPSRAEPCIHQSLDSLASLQEKREEYRRPEDPGEGIFIYIHTYNTYFKEGE